MRKEREGKKERKNNHDCGDIVMSIPEWGFLLIQFVCKWAVP